MSDYVSTPEPAPTGNGAIVLDEAVKMVREANYDNEWLAQALISRAEQGKAKYGDYLRTNNGRNALVDYLQEQLDAIMYAVQAHAQSPCADTSMLIVYAVHASRLVHGLIENA